MFKRFFIALLTLVCLFTFPAAVFADATGVPEPSDLPVISDNDPAPAASSEVRPMEVIEPDQSADQPADPDDDPDNNPDNNIDEPTPLPDELEVWVFDPDTNTNLRTKVVPVSLSLNGQPLVSDVPAMATQGRTLVPVRVISESLAAAVKWDKPTNTVTITKDEQEIILTIGSATALVNGEETAIPGDVSVGLVNYAGAARTMVPVRFVSENLAAEVNYDQASRVVDIIPPPEPEPEPDDESSEDDQTAEPEPEPLIPGIDENGRLIRRVVVDAGHGGADPGTSGGGHYEKTVNLAVAQKTKTLLEAAGFEVIAAREGDDYVGLLERAALTTEQDAPVFVSIHCNSAEKISTASGIETYAAPDDFEDSRLAALVQKQLIAATGAKDRGVKESRLVVLTHNLAPACLVEIGFMSNQAECAKLWDPAYQQKLATAITRGVEAYFELRDSEPPVEQPSRALPIAGTSDLLPFTE